MKHFTLLQQHGNQKIGLTVFKLTDGLSNIQWSVWINTRYRFFPFINIVSWVGHRVIAGITFFLRSNMVFLGYIKSARPSYRERQQTTESYWIALVSPIVYNLKEIFKRLSFTRLENFKNNFLLVFLITNTYLEWLFQFNSQILKWGFLV